MQKGKTLDSNTIINLYFTKNLTPRQIGILFHVSDMTIRNLLKNNNVKMRPRGELHKLKINNKGTLEYPIVGDTCRGIDIGLNDPSYYVRVSCPKCKQERWQVKNHSKLSQLCRECSLNPRLDNQGTIESPVIGDVQKGEDIGKSKQYYKWVSCPECHQCRWESSKHSPKFHLCPTCACYNRGFKLRGEKCHLWRGGGTTEIYPREFNDSLKELIRKRDNYTCQLCGKPQNGTKLSVHHIDYIKLHCDPTNLISLCPARTGDCHARTNSHHREYWAAYFQDILRVRGIIK
jgi:predicted Zn-ribbon and HTH transcriptional regulator